MDIRTLGIDLAKNLFQVHEVDGQRSDSGAAPAPPRAAADIYGAAATRAWWRWRRVAAPTIGPARLPSTVTKSG